jgi:hypothetical protein
MSISSRVSSALRGAANASGASHHDARLRSSPGQGQNDLASWVRVNGFDKLNEYGRP